MHQHGYLQLVEDAFVGKVVVNLSGDVTAVPLDRADQKPRTPPVPLRLAAS